MSGRSVDYEALLRELEKAPQGQRRAEEQQEREAGLRKQTESNSDNWRKSESAKQGYRLSLASVRVPFASCMPV